MRKTLPHLDRLFLTDGGIETDLIYNREDSDMVARCRTLFTT